MKWVDLQPELLALVLDRLHVGDRVRFGAVCTSWRSAAAAAENRRRPATPESPWLMLNNDKDKGDVEFFSLAEWRSYRLHLPQFRENRFICSFDGWLVTAESPAELRLINSLTGTVARLPTLPIPDGAEGVARDPVDGRIIGYYFQSDDHVRVLDAWYPSPYSTKLGFFPSSSIAMATCWRPNLYFARIGGDSWTELSLDTMPIDHLLFHQGRVYGVTDETDFAFDFDLDDGGARLLPRKTTFKRPERSTFGSRDYLVETPDGVDLLQVVMEVPNFRHHAPVENEINFMVFKLEKSRLEWIQLKSLDGYVLFCGMHSCIAISTLGVPELRANSIYFTKRLLLVASPRCNSTEVMRFDIEDGRVDRGFPPGHPLDELKLRPLVWAKPLLSRDRHVS